VPTNCVIDDTSFLEERRVDGHRIAARRKKTSRHEDVAFDHPIGDVEVSA
jgi:hypothetical protein